MLIGCGYLGTVVARLAVERYRRIDAYVASPTPRPELDRAGVSIHVGDVFSGATKGLQHVCGTKVTVIEQRQRLGRRLRADRDLEAGRAHGNLRRWLDRRGVDRGDNGEQQEDRRRRP